MSFWIIAEMTVKEELKDEFLKLVQEVVDESNKEPGINVYTLVQEAKGPKDLGTRPAPLKFYMVENYKDLNAFKHHFQTAHYKKWSAISAKYRTMDGAKFYAPVVVGNKPKM